MGARSRRVSKPMLAISAGFVACVSKTSTKVCPSGAERATCAVPSEPEPPPRFSTITGTPSSAESGPCTRRKMVSTLPPGGKGAIMLMGPFGQAG